MKAMSEHNAQPTSKRIGFFMNVVLLFFFSGCFQFIQLVTILQTREKGAL